MVDYNDQLLSEEQAHPELRQKLEALYQTTAAEEQMLARVHEKLARLARDPLPSAQEPLATSVQPLKVVSSASSFRSARPNKVAFNRFNNFAAVLFVGLLVGSLALTFGIIHYSKSSTHGPPSTAPVKNGMWIESGLRLKMFTLQSGWALGDSQHGAFDIVLHTTDGGRHWQNANPPGYSGDFSGGSIYVLDENTAWLPLFDSHRHLKQGQVVGLLRTVNGGKSWQQMTIITNQAPPNLTFSDQNNGWQLVTPVSLKPVQLSAIASGHSPMPGKTVSTFYHTSNGGKTWQKLGMISATFINMRFFDEQRGWAIGYSSDPMQKSFFATTNGGLTWTARLLPAPSGEKRDEPPKIVDLLTFVNAREGYILAGFSASRFGPFRYYVYQTLDAGNTWRVVDGRLPDNVGMRSLLDSRHAIGETSPSGLGLASLTLTNGHWEQMALHAPEPGDRADVSFLSPNVGFVLIATQSTSSTQYKTLDLYLTKDGGKTWYKLASFPKGS